jgi:hypothetical protein
MSKSNKPKTTKAGIVSSVKQKQGDITSKVKTRNKEIDTAGFTHNQSDMMNQKDIPAVKLANAAKAKKDGIKSWWLFPEKELGAAVQEVVWRIDMQNNEKRNSWITYARLYGNNDAMGWTVQNPFSQQLDNKPSLNVIQSCIDTVNSKVAKDNPRPYFMTDGANYFQRLRAEYMSKFTQAAFTYMRLYEKANNNVFRDSSLFGLGGLKFYVEGGKPQCEWVFINEIKVDKYDAWHGEPRSMHQTKLMTKERALALFDSPEQQHKIEQNVGPMPAGYSQQRWSVVDLVVVTESWHLPSTPGADDGVHCFTVGDDVLELEKYTKDYFPFVFHRYYNNTVGFYGRGIAQQIRSGQYEIDKMLRKMKHGYETAGVPFILMPMGAEVAEEQMLNNEMMRMVTYNSAAGVQPTVVSPQVFDPAFSQLLKDWINWCFQEVGITQVSASGQKQSGINSAVALRTMVDIESSRYLQVAKNWNQFFIDCALMTIRICNQLIEDNEVDLKFPFFDSKGKASTEIDYKRIAMEEDDFTIRCDLASAFSGSFSSKLQTVSDFIDRNYISKERGMEMLELGDPDVEREINLCTATLKLCEKRLTEIVEEDLYTPPDPYMNLTLAQEVSQATLVLLQSQNCPEEQLKNVRLWVDAIIDLKNLPDTSKLQSQFAPPPASPGPPGPLPGTPTNGLPPPGAPLPPQQ